jgi:hypothetical protein
MTHISKPLREGDSLIMEDFMAMQHYSPLELYRLNLCRKYLNVACLSEICNTTGNELLREPWHGRRPADSQSALYWPNQARPHEPSWNAWRCALKLAYLGPEIVRATKNRTTLPLNCPLGAWIGDRHRSQRLWTHYVSKDSTILYSSKSVGFRLYHNIPGPFRRRRFEPTYYSALPDLSTVPNIIPVSIQPARSSIDSSRLPRPALIPDEYAPIDLAPPTTFRQRLEQIIEDWQQPLLEHLECHSQDERLHELLLSGNELIFQLTTDGGARDDLGSFGWEIAIEREIIWTCKGPTFGQLPGSFRAESYGLLSAALFLDVYFSYYDTPFPDPQPIIKCYIDSMSLIDRVLRNLNRTYVNPSRCLASDYDLESGILFIITNLPIAISFFHVKSHQDDAVAVEALPWIVQMNVHADQLATDYLDNHAKPSSIVPFIPASGARLNINGITINRRFPQQLRLAASGPNICTHLMTRNNWTEPTFRSINWTVPSKALLTLERSTQIFIIKFAHDHLPTRRHMYRIKQAETDKCPACHHIVESAWHIFSCPRRSIWREKFLQTLHDTLSYNHTQPDLTLILLQGIRGALSNPTFQMSAANREPQFVSLVNAQNKIGWQHILKGRFSNRWLQIQQLHIRTDPDIDPTTQSSERWLKQVLNHIWTSLWDVWIIRNADLHGRDNAEQEQKRKEKLRPHVIALYATVDSLLACDKPIFDTPIRDRLKAPSREIATWIRLVTPTVKRALADAKSYLLRTNHRIEPFMTIARPDPLTRDEQVNELRPVSRLD